jgi:hypothetical protein
MPVKDEPSPFEFAKYALQRNDEAIRYSETKAGFLLALVGLLLAVVAGELSNLKGLFAHYSCPSTVLLAISLVLIVPGMIVLTTASLAAVLPRLRVTQLSSYLYFGSLASSSEADLPALFQQLTSSEMNRHVLAQVHATATIAQRKFSLMRTATVATGVVLLGLAIAVFALFLAPLPC